jgi:hypothetical protein
LLRVDWPQSIVADVKAMLRADGAVTGDLRMLNGLNVFSAGNWSNQFVRDAGQVLGRGQHRSR